MCCGYSPMESPMLKFLMILTVLTTLGCTKAAPAPAAPDSSADGLPSDATTTSLSEDATALASDVTAAE
jgi:hypothetical protein